MLLSALKKVCAHYGPMRQSAQLRVMPGHLEIHVQVEEVVADPHGAGNEHARYKVMKGKRRDEEGDGTRPAVMLGFNALDPTALTNLQERVNGMYWKKRKLGAQVMRDRFA